MPDLGREDILSINQKGWNKVAPLFYGGTALPIYGPLAETEDELNLIPELSDKSVLELACGSGHSLVYLWETKNAKELWGLDFSEEQIPFTKELLDQKSIPVQLFLSSTDESPVCHISWRGVEIIINHRKLSTYLNAITKSGLNLDRIIESEPNITLAREQDFEPEKWYSVPRSQLVPTTFIVKTYKPPSLNG